MREQARAEVRLGNNVFVLDGGALLIVCAYGWSVSHGGRGAKLPLGAGASWLAEWKPMSNSNPSRYPVTVTHLPVVRCAVCRRTVAHRPGQASIVLTKHYEKAHPDLVGGN